MSLFERLPDSIIYFSKLVGTTIKDPDGRKIGHFCDFFADFDDTFPLILAVSFSHKGHFFYIKWTDIDHFSYKEIIISDTRKIRVGRTYSTEYREHNKPRHLFSDKVGRSIINYPGLAYLVLDKQIVDTHGKKVVRVNDLQFIKVGRNLRVTYASIGLKGLLRRLGFDFIVDLFIRLFNPKSSYFFSESVISWKHVHTIPVRNLYQNVKLNISNDDIKKIHPADLADILEDLNSYDRKELFEQLDPETKALTLSEISGDKQLSLIDIDKPQETAEIIENMDPDEAVDILSELNEKKADEIVAQIKDDEIQEDIQELLEYDENSAGGIMSTESFEVAPNYTKGEILETIQEKNEEFESVYDVYVLDDSRKLLGTCTLSELLTHKDNVQIKDIMETEDLKFLKPKESWKTVASYMSKYNLINVPITNDKNELLGIVTVDDILSWTLDEK